MGRPRLDAEQRRTRQVGVRVTKAEAAELAAAAKARGWSTLAAFVRAAALRTARADTSAEATPPELIDQASLDHEAEVRRELRRIGVNVNQIARGLHAGWWANRRVRQAVNDLQRLITLGLMR